MSFCHTHNQAKCPHFALTKKNFKQRCGTPPAGSTCDTLMEIMISQLFDEIIPRIRDPNSSPSKEQLLFLENHLFPKYDVKNILHVAFVVLNISPAGVYPIHQRLHRCEYKLEQLLELALDERIKHFNQLAEWYNQKIRL